MEKELQIKIEKSPEELKQEVERVVKKMHTDGVTLKEALGVKDEFLEEMYGLAYNNYEQGKLKEALGLFQILVGCAPNEIKFVYGLASCQHQMQEYNEAVGGFAIALALDPLNPFAAFYIADCYLRMDLFADAKDYLKLAVGMCSESQKYSVLKQQAELILNNIENFKKEAYKYLDREGKKS